MISVLKKKSSNITHYNFPQHDLEHSGFKLFQLKTNAQKVKGLPYFPAHTSIPHAHNFYEICLFFRASGVHNIDFKSYKIQSGAIHIIAPGRVHLIQPGPGTEGFIVAFSSGFYDSFAPQNKALSQLAFYNLQLSQPILNLDAAATDYLKNWVKNLILDLTTSQQQPIQLHWSHLNLLLWKIHALYEADFPFDHQSRHNTLELFYKFKRLVEEYFVQKHQVQDYANMLYISPGHLNRISKMVSGETASRVIQDRIVLEAKRLLCYSDKTNREIAFQLNFRDPSHFTRLFKNVTNLTPSAFRNQASGG